MAVPTVKPALLGTGVCVMRSVGPAARALLRPGKGGEPPVGPLRRRAGVPPRSRGALQCRAVKVTLLVQHETKFGQSLKVTGGHPALGDWNAEQGAGLTWGEGHVWSCTLDLPEGQEVEFKLVKASEEGMEWEGGGNRHLRVPGRPTSFTARWGKQDSLKHVKEGSDGVAQAAAQARNDAPAPTSQGAQRELGEVLAALDNDRLAKDAWQGSDVSFMRANNWSRDRDGVWDTSGLAGAALALVEGDKKAANWLAKLGVVKQVLVDDAPNMRPGPDALANAFIYMQWVATGAIPCVEGGGHYRPNHHAKLGQTMFRSLEWVMEGDDGEAALLARRLQSNLPSFSDEFTAAVPLTRIRDIAHRNDIPHELKQEIKHTLQNKLHRNAGPEDLVATEAMLARLLAEAPSKGYSDAFLHEFRVFTAELQSFFSAGSLTDMLNALRPALDDGGEQVLQLFLDAKAKLEGDPSSPAALMQTMHTLTSLRALLVSGLASGLRNDAPDSALAMRQRWRLSEVKCEEYAFVLLSRFINALGSRGGPGALAGGGDAEWGLPLGAAVLGVRHLGLSGWDPAECMALENELAAWQKQGGFGQRDNALRLKATLERAQFLTQAFSDWQLRMFSARADALGRALGLPAERVNVFTEAEIRASVVFQLSKLVSFLLKAARSVTGNAAWDTLVAGSAMGKLVAVDCIDPATVPGPEGGDIVLLVAAASGDEEVAAVGPHLKAVILCQSLPHLSHLGVRARQERVVFVCAEDPEMVEDAVKPLVGHHVALEAAAEKVTLVAAAAPAAAPATNGKSPNGKSPNGSKPANAAASGSKVEKVQSPTVLPLHNATVATSGAKSNACAELARIERSGAKSGSGFKTPAGCVLPFGSMDCAVKASGKQQQFQQLLAALEDADIGSLEALCSEMQALLAACPPDQATLREIAAMFDGAPTVIARSSSNVEDLAGMSGAGLYESIGDVPLNSPDALADAIAEVWASLYTRRAVLSRRAAGVPQSDASMAVLVMEMLSPQLSFVLHTVSPLEHDDDVLYAELAVGQGETLASGTRGSAWRISVDKPTGKVTTHAFANFSRAFVPSRSAAAAATAVAARPGTQTVDYSRHALSNDPTMRDELGRRLAAVGVELERAFGGPQDVEGCLVGGELYIVQTRPQP